MRARRLTCIFGLIAVAGPAERAARADDWPQLGLDGGRGRASSEISGPAFQAAWQARLASGAIVSSPAVADGFVVVAGSDGQLGVVRATDGAPLWSARADGAIAASPAVDRGRLFVPTLTGRLQAFRLADGQMLWSRALGGQNLGSPAISGDSLVLAAGSPEQKLLRLASATGATEWETA